VGSRPFFPVLCHERQIDSLPHAVLLHMAEVPIDRLPRREMIRQHAPLAPALVQKKNGVEDLPRVVLPHRATAIGAGQQWLHDFPLGISQITGVTATHAAKKP
jgi:hypothetical protein